jgi:hypothetical protein
VVDDHTDLIAVWQYARRPLSIFYTGNSKVLHILRNTGCQTVFCHKGCLIYVMQITKKIRSVRRRGSCSTCPQTPFSDVNTISILLSQRTPAGGHHRISMTSNPSRSSHPPPSTPPHTKPANPPPRLSPFAPIRTTPSYPIRTVLRTSPPRLIAVA